MAGWDDDDWTGTPPEGRHPREQADPGFWRRYQLVVPGIGMTLLGLIVLALVLFA